MKIKEFLREDPKQNSNALPNIALFRRLSFVVLKTTKFLYVMLLYPFYVFVGLSADVSYFLCCPLSRSMEQAVETRTGRTAKVARIQ